MEPITLALAKGRTARDTFTILENSGIYFNDFHKNSRKLIFFDEINNIKLLYVKAVDVPTYVEKGAADIGIVGKDNILESQANIYELLDLNIGKCKFVAASKSQQPIKNYRSLTVASKYTYVANNFFSKKGIPVETIKLNGSVELAPLIQLADVIVDIVETGTTLDENGLTILEEISDISTRLIVNKASFATKTNRIQEIIEQIRNGLE